MTLVEVGNTWGRVTGLPPPVVGAVDAVTSYRTQAAATGTWQSPEALLGQPVWDGVIHLCRFPAPDTVLFPTGLLDLVVGELTRWSVRHALADGRVRPEMGVPDRGALPLRPYQRAAVEALWAAGQGVLEMPPRSGKTRTMLEALRGIALPSLWIEIGRAHV